MEKKINETNEESEDIVIQEIDVFINRLKSSYSESESEGSELNNCSIYLLQFPLRPYFRSYGDQGRLINIYKRKTQKTLLFEYEMVSDSCNYSSTYSFVDKNSMVQGNGSKQEMYHKLNSISVESDCDSYGIAMLKKSQLFIIPLNRILQFRPDFSHLDQNDEISRSLIEMGSLKNMSIHDDFVNRNSNMIINTGTSTVKESKKSDLSMTKESEFATHNNSSINMTIPKEDQWHKFSAAKIYDFMMNDSWEKVSFFYDSTSPESVEIMNLLTSTESFKKDSENVSNIINLTKSEIESIPKLHFSSDITSYSNYLCSNKYVGSALTMNNSHDPLSYLNLYKLSLEKQILRILRFHEVESFGQIKKLLTVSKEDHEIIYILQRHADLILGNWVAKSHLYYKGLSCHCRDILLFLLSKGHPVVRDTVKPFMGSLPLSELTKILEQIANYQNNAWYFKLPADLGMIQKYPELVKESSQKYSKEAMKRVMEKIQMIEKAEANPEFLKEKESLVLDNNDVFNNLLTETFRKHGAQTPEQMICNLKNLLHNKVVNFSISEKESNNILTSLNEENLLTVLPRLSFCLGCNYWVLNKLGNSIWDSHRDVILTMFKQKLNNDSANKSKKGFTRSQILQEFDNRKVKFSLPDYSFRELLKEISVNIDGYWIFKGNVFKETGCISKT